MINSQEVKFKNCSKLEESIKLGTKIYLGMGEVRFIRSHPKIYVKTISVGGGGPFAFVPYDCLS